MYVCVFLCARERERERERETILCKGWVEYIIYILCLLYMSSVCVH